MLHFGKASVLVSVLLLLVVAAPSVQASAVRQNWININTFNFVVHKASGHDTFLLKGSFNLAPNSIDSTSEVILTIGTGVFDYTSGTLAPVGKSGKYKGSIGNVAAEIDYWVGGTSRCNFTFVGSKQDLPSIIGPDATSIELQVGDDFDESAEVDIYARFNSSTVTGKMRYFQLDGNATFVVDSLRVIRNLHKSSADSATLVGHMWDQSFDSAADDVTIIIGTFQATMPAGSLSGTAATKTRRYRGALPGGGNIAVTGDQNGKFTMVVTGVDLSSITNPAEVVLRLTGGITQTWAYDLTLKVNTGQTLYTY